MYIDFPENVFFNFPPENYYKKFKNKQKMEYFNKIKENGTGIFRIELPGVKKEDINIETSNMRLRVYGKKTIDNTEFNEVCLLPFYLDSDSGKARLENGVLEVVFQEIKKNTKNIKVE